MSSGMPPTGSLSFPIPYRVLRRLFRHCKLGPGARVLDVGCGRGELVILLRHLGVETVGVDLLPPGEPVFAEAAPHVHFGQIAGHFPHPPHAFDLILTRGLSTYHSGLGQNESFALSANLLSSLRPGGHLVAFEPAAPAKGLAPDLVRVQALVDHFSAFPVPCAARKHRESLGWYLRGGWLFEGTVELFLIALSVATEPVSRLQWHRIARDAVLRQQRSNAGQRAA